MELGWTDFPDSLSIYHQQGAGHEENDKWVSPDGHSEAVFDENDKPVEHIVNQATYNMADPINDSVGHVIQDVNPYYVWGNSPNDPSTFWEGITASYDEDC